MRKKSRIRREDLFSLVSVNRIIKTLSLIILLFSKPLMYAQSINDDFTGKWKAPKGAIIIVSKNATGFIGRTEKENAVVLKDVKFLKGKWLAIVLNPKENIVANCELMLETDHLKIIVRKGVLYKTIIWLKQ